MISRFFSSVLIGLLVGAGLGVFLGWGPLPVEYLDGPASALDQRYQDEYTVMVAAGYLVDRDLQGAIDRLRVLQVENIPSYVQQTTERFITNSHDIEDIQFMVALAEAMGRLTPVMEDYRMVTQRDDS